MDLATSNRSICLNPNRRKNSLSPLFLALIIQVGSLLCVVALAVAARYSLSWLLPLYFFLLAHCLLSSFIAFLAQCEWWWCLIHFLFPVALVAGLYINLPPWISLCSFFVLFLIFGSTLRTRVPYYPSSSDLPELLMKGVPDVERELTFLDVGSGFGGLLLDLSRRQNQWKLHGVEIAILPWLVSKIRVLTSSQNSIHVRFLNYEALDFSEFDVVFAYLSPVVMADVWRKAKKEMRPGSVFMSYEFSVSEQEPNFVFSTTYENVSLYVWQM